MWFGGWESLARIIALGTLGYVALIVLLRVSGKRTLSKMNAFDFVVTITLGSVFGGLILNQSVSLSEGVVALGLLISLQWLMTTLYVRSTWFERVIKGEPQLLYNRGEYLDRALKRERVTREEVQAAMRDGNVVEDQNTLAVLETDGSVTVFTAADQQEPHAMKAIDDEVGR